MTTDPHRDGPVRSVGTPLKGAIGAVILLHGRGASAEDILSIAQDLYLPGLAYLAPQAVGNTWYPNSFLVPRERNEPWLSSALNKVGTVLKTIQDAGISPERIVVCGFSQGACLASEFVATHPRRYAGVIAFTGGLIGPPDANLDHAGDLAGTPALFASGDPDPHVPWQRVQESADIFAKMGAVVTTRRYPGRAHTVSAEELDVASQLIRDAFSEA
jgi:phospholipase/carboxylesterase